MFEKILFWVVVVWFCGGVWLTAGAFRAAPAGESGANKTRRDA